ncbi:hypothetical protein P879_04640 [Paragonimus westermani]|uniref:Uncharacterized protein n=1 Tax=Paragonimus westermani TaxID=34504 RepID=A0A8T0D2V9_9TREM|nr:hypothetical protein P879_04640 [Paragonimus westermani]
MVMTPGTTLLNCNLMSKFPRNYRGWENSATNILGDKRKEMTNNVLHQRSILGRPNTHCRTLPSKSFTYGMKNIKKDGVAQAMCWPDERISDSTDRTEFTSDFLALNCESVKFGVTNCKELAHFRATHDIKRKDPSHNMKKRSHTTDCNIVHGITNRSSTPMNEILANKYQTDWIEGQLRKASKAQQDKKHSHFTAPAETKTSLLRSTKPTSKAESFWKLPQFTTKAHGGINTFRDERHQKMAYKVYCSEKPARFGMHGQGIYRTGAIV